MLLCCLFRASICLDYASFLFYLACAVRGRNQPFFRFLPLVSRQFAMLSHLEVNLTCTFVR